MRTDIDMRNSYIFKQWAESDARETVRTLGLEEEQAVALMLRLPEFDWFEELSVADVLELREMGGIELFRKAFSEERKRIRYAGLLEFPSVATSVHENLKKYVTEHQRQLKLEREQYRRKLRRASLEFGTTLVLSVVSVAAPPIAVITIPLAAVSAIYGGVSVRDLAKMIRSGRESHEMVSRRPVGVLARYLDLN